MTFEDLENNFNKKAEKQIQTNFQAMNDENLASEEEKEKYEDIAEAKPVHGLLAKFQEKLLNRARRNNKSDEEFETIEISSDAVLPISSDVNEVSKEDIDKLLKTEPSKYSSKFENIDTSVEETITSYQQPGADVTMEDLNSELENVIQPRYEDVHPVTEKYARRQDVQVGYDPVNKASVNPSAPQEIHPMENPTPREAAPYSQKEIGDEVVDQYIAEHRRKRAENAQFAPESLPDYSEEDLTGPE